MMITFYKKDDMLLSHILIKVIESIQITLSKTSLIDAS